jgi:ADP-ribosyl-[dinitrogen reductase] hydrolase
VRFEVTAPFDRIGFCHCTSCKKLSGGAGTVSGRVRTDAIHVTSGEELLITYQPAEGSAKTFCSVCGTNLFGGGWPESPMTPVRLPTLDEPFEGRIEAHLFVRSVAPWEELPDDDTARHDGRAP